MVGGFIVAMLGTGAILGGASLAGAEAAQPGSTTSSEVPGLAVMEAGVVAYIIGACIMAGAVPHLYDAINAYNDGVETPAR